MTIFIQIRIMRLEDKLPETKRLLVGGVMGKNEELDK